MHEVKSRNGKKKGLPMVCRSKKKQNTCTVRKKTVILHQLNGLIVSKRYVKLLNLKQKAK